MSNTATETRIKPFNQHSNSSVYLTDNQVFKVIYKDDTVLEKNDFELVVRDYINASVDGILKVMIIFPPNATLSVDARVYAQSREIPALAEAVVFETLSQRLLFKFYQKFRSIPYPIKGFKDEESALSWLNGF